MTQNALQTQEPLLNGSIDHPNQANSHIISAEHDAQQLSIDRPQSSQKRIQRTFNSIESAKNLLDAIATRFDNNSEMIHIEIVLKDSEYQKAYQSLFDRDYGDG